MSKITRLLKSYKDKSLEKLLTAYKENPYHARVIFKSDGFTYDLKEDKLYLEQYLDIDGNPIPTNFRYVIKSTYYMIGPDHKLKTKVLTTFSLKSLDNKFTIKEIDMEIDTDNLSFSEYENDDLIKPDTLTPRKIMNLENTPTLRGLLLKEFITRHSWSAYLFEHNVLDSVPLTEIYEKKLFNLKKALQHEYPKLPFEKAKEYHKLSNLYHYFVKDVHEKDNQSLSHAERIASFLEFLNKTSTWEVGYRSPGYYFRSYFYNSHKKNLDKVENFNMDWAKDTQLGKLATNVSLYGKYLDRKVNCGWSEAKLNDINNKWTKEYAAIIHKYDDRVFEIPTIYKMMDEHSPLELIKSLSELSFEGFKQNHCVGGYEENIESGECGIFRYKGHTIQLNYGRISQLRYVTSLRKHGLKVSEFRGFSNIEPSHELRMEVQGFVKEFNKRLLLMPLETYIMICNDIDETFRKYHESKKVDVETAERLRPRRRPRGNGVERMAGEVADVGRRWDEDDAHEDERGPHPMDITDADLADEEPMDDAPVQVHGDIVPLLNAIGDRHRLRHVERLIEETREAINDEAEMMMGVNRAADILGVVDMIAENGGGEEEGRELAQAIIRNEVVDASDYLVDVEQGLLAELRDNGLEDGDAVTFIGANGENMHGYIAGDAILAGFGTEDVGEEVCDTEYSKYDAYEFSARHSRDDKEIEAAVDYFLGLIGSLRAELEASGVDVVVDENQTGDNIKDVFSLYITEYTEDGFTPEKFYEEHKDIIEVAKEEMKTVDLFMISKSFEILKDIQRHKGNEYFDVIAHLYTEYRKSQMA